MEKITINLVNNSWEIIDEVSNKMSKMIRSEVKEKGEIIIPKDDEMISPTICYKGGKDSAYANNAISSVNSMKWDEKYNDVMISCEDGVQLLRNCNVDDIFVLAETIAYINGE